MRTTYFQRSILVTPGTKTELFIKNLTSNADINLLDLEDGVSSEMKDFAREKVTSLDIQKFQNKKNIAIRINSPKTLVGMNDIQAIIKGKFHPNIIVLPKIENAADVQYVDMLLTSQKIDCSLWAIIETPLGVHNAVSIAHSSSRLTALSFGAADFSAELCIKNEWDLLLFARSAVVMAAHSASLDISDAPTFDMSDLMILKKDSEKAKSMGFTGKTAIHPSQVDIINEAFAFDSKIIEWARNILALYDGKNNDIQVMDGVMVGPPFIRKAKKILASIGE